MTAAPSTSEEVICSVILVLRQEICSGDERISKWTRTADGAAQRVHARRWRHVHRRSTHAVRDHRWHVCTCFKTGTQLSGQGTHRASPVSLRKEWMMLVKFT